MAKNPNPAAPTPEPQPTASLTVLSNGLIEIIGTVDSSEHRYTASTIPKAISWLASHGYAPLTAEQLADLNRDIVARHQIPGAAAIEESVMTQAAEAPPAE